MSAQVAVERPQRRRGFGSAGPLPCRPRRSHLPANLSKMVRNLVPLPRFLKSIPQPFIGRWNVTTCPQHMIGRGYTVVLQAQTGHRVDEGVYESNRAIRTAIALRTCCTTACVRSGKSDDRNIRTTLCKSSAQRCLRAMSCSAWSEKRPESTAA